MLFTGFTNLFLGSAVFLYNPRKKINQIYFFLAFGLGIWGLSLAAILISWNIDLLILITELVIKGSTFVNHALESVPGPLYFPFLLYAVFCVLGSVYLLFQKFRKSAGMAREQIKYVFLGFALFAVPAIVTNGVLPGVFGVSEFNKLGPSFSVFLLGAIAYAILEYRLMDINFVLRQGTLFTLIFAVIIFIFVLATSLFSKMLGGAPAIIIPAIIITLGFIPFKNFLEKVIDKFFFRSRYDFRTATRDITKTFSKIEDLDKLLEEFLKKLVSYLKVPKAEIILLLEKDHFISRLSIGVGEQNDLVLPKNNALVQHFEKHPDEILERDYLVYLTPREEHRKEELLKLHKELDKFGYAARLFEQTQQLNKELLTANQAKSHFITIVSHQFRTPLSAIRMNAELLEDNLKKRFLSAVDETESVQIIQERAIFMVNMLENVFDGMAIDAHKVSVDKKPAVIWEIFDNVKKEISREIEKKRINFILDKSPELLQEIDIDIPKITKVVKILLENAAFYNKEGGIIEVKMNKVTNEEKRFIQCSVKDEGIGVPPEDTNKIFEKFYRSPNAMNLVPNGTGLGLFIAKNFVELHGGKLWVASQPGQGSTFYFTLPED
ncbi:MAG: Sensory box histidine kinase [Candidatus Azambacteria bacterium GW2011_GWC1_46_13]|uniref:histidine kinase n=3 Tax=Candidatus Azamiibacteriota TaxID=1752741 RepID=A0A0G1NNQ0_9BACT|nr:MAG: Sensory box histidine kinase [Candidatus Azambacteria bacterium GW2011_GWC1_46_13]